MNYDLIERNKGLTNNIGKKQVVRKKTKLKNYVGQVLENGLTEAQEMWFDTIVAVITQPKFTMGLGNMDYVLGNMVAKYVSSSKYYKITENAVKYVEALGINLNEPLHVKKHIYGQKKSTLLEHIIPASVIKNSLVKNKDNLNQIKHILHNAGFVVIATRAEDKLLKDAKLSDKMPENWTGFGDAPEKRYTAVNIQISSLVIEHCGQICR
jgi:hypothetical protein